MIDTHAHMIDAAFTDDLPEVLASASAAGVRAIVSVTESADDISRNLSLCATSHLATCRMLPAVGLHPEVVSTLTTEETFSQLAILEAAVEAHKDKLVAIGE
eukprot:gene3023-3581_t